MRTAALACVVLFALPALACAAEQPGTSPTEGLTAEEIPGAVVGPWTPAKAGAILAAPAQFAGKRVELAGEYRGTKPGRFSPLRGLAPRLATDWILGDETGEVYVANRPEVEVGVSLHPEYTLKVRVVVRGTVRVADSGVPYIEPELITKRRGDRGAYCSLEVLPPDAWRDGAIGFRIILKNDTGRALELMYPAGFTHDLVVSRDGVEVWRWSRHAGALQGIGREVVQPRPELEKSDRLLLPPDNSRVYVEYWPQVDNEGNPVPLGKYQVQGIISARIWTYPITVEAGYPPEVLEALRAGKQGQ